MAPAKQCRRLRSTGAPPRARHTAIPEWWACWATLSWPVFDNTSGSPTTSVNDGVHGCNQELGCGRI
eukprot:5230730-Prorocentrum_lima.AAC.1